MYFAILWKHKDISRTELETCIDPTLMTWHDDIVYINHDKCDTILKQLWWIVKYGRIINLQDLTTMLDPQTCWCIAVQDKSYATYLKHTYGYKRYKIVWHNHTDKEIRDHGKELIQLHHNQIGIVDWYQNIDLYTTIDVHKPSHGMQIGMMPAKLAHIMINVAVWNRNYLHTPTICDPFCGFGTTLLVSNAIGYHSIWSDINITQTKPNIKRWKTQSYYHPQSHLTIFKHDVQDTWDHPVMDHVDAIVTEWRLGPVVSRQTTQSQYQDYSTRIVHLYKIFLTHIQPYRIPQIVMTVPHYFNSKHNSVCPRIFECMSELGYKIHPIKQIYHRPWQLVGRQIVVGTITHIL
jgi:hypothetical protein